MADWEGKTEIPVNIVNVGYGSVNYYTIDIDEGKLLVDCGWPGTLPRFSARLRQKGMTLRDIRYLLVTHFHPDHAGLTQELKNAGAGHILPDCQIGHVAWMTEFFRNKSYPYVEIRVQDSLVLVTGESRRFLAGLGLAGEILSTPGHSDDSVTLVLDEGFAFTGDLPPLSATPDEDAVTRRSWARIHRHGIKQVFPAHGKQRSA
jgi:ribonuclease/clavin/mitogillin